MGTGLQSGDKRAAFNGRNRTLELLQGPDDQFVQVLRLNKECFYRLSSLLTENGLRDTRSISAHEQLMMFLTIVGHCDTNRRSKFEWRHSGETVSRHFHNVCAYLLALAPRLIGPPDFVHTASKIENNPNFFPYFRDCIGAMDGTHVMCIVDADLQAAFRNRKGFTMAGWEGSVHDARVLRDAQCDQSFRFPHPPAAPYRGTNYHLRNRRRQGGDLKNERFNYCHSSLRNVMERTFGIWKSRFQILRGMPHYTVRMQRDIIIACAVLHNFIKMFADDADLFNNEGEQQEDGGDDQDVDPSTQQQNLEAIAMGDLRDHIGDTIWDSEH
ncbi:hypothetical protein UlMin_041337 [Ulmus minor]